MEIDYETILELAKEIDPVEYESLSRLFREMLDEEHSSRHTSKPRFTKKFIDMVDNERRSE
tara:strand:+ start:70 stop:252 length:183 start_codon:yes stop_codon:yes gene_type:complete